MLLIIFKNDEEKAFVNTLIHTSQAIHEQELVANRNELRRVCDSEVGSSDTS